MTFHLLINTVLENEGFPMCLSFEEFESYCLVLIFLIRQEYCVDLLLQRVQKFLDVRSKDPHCAIDYLNHAFALFSVQFWSLTHQTCTSAITERNQIST